MIFASHFFKIYLGVNALCLVRKRPSVNDCAHRGSAASDLFATTLAAAGNKMSREPKQELLKEFAAEWEERDGEMVEAEFRQ